MLRSREIRKVLATTLVLNLAVAGAKMAYGYHSGSIAITSDGFHSLFDGVSNIVGLVGIHIASQPPDRTHPYGHRKYETLFAVMIGLLMLITCYEILKESVASFRSGQRPALDAASFALMLVTLGVNLFVVTYERRMGRKLGSEFLLADSLHTQTDVYVTLGVIASIGFVLLGYPVMDPVAGLIVALFVARAGFQIIKESTDILVDTTPTDIARIETAACSVPGTVECHAVRTRGTKSHIFLDIHILVDPIMPVQEAHDIAEQVETRIKEAVPEIVDVVVHIEPATERYRKR